MFKQIILLFAVLIPSLCFGKSLRIELKQTYDKNYYLVTLTYSKEKFLHEYKRFAFEFNPQQMIPVSASNQNKWKELNLIITDKLNLKPQTGSKKKEFGGLIPWIASDLERRFLDLLIGNNWMITSYSNTDGKVNIFAYKKD